MKVIIILAGTLVLILLLLLLVIFHTSLNSIANRKELPKSVAEMIPILWIATICAMFVTLSIFSVAMRENYDKKLCPEKQKEVPAVQADTLTLEKIGKMIITDNYE